jgi:hypothetical protein
MSYPAFTRPDLFSIPAAKQAELVAALRSQLSGGSYPPVGNNPLLPDSVLHAFGEPGYRGKSLANCHRGQRTEARR